MRGTTEIPGVTLDEHGEVAAYDIEAQCRSVFHNVRTVLEDAGLSASLLRDPDPLLVEPLSAFRIDKSPKP